ncbi:hypothetical protein ABZU25_10310 [Micromonospora sp. NPDC005215]
MSGIAITLPVQRLLRTAVDRGRGMTTHTVDAGPITDVRCANSP